MNKKDALTKILAVAGTAFVWLPILAPVFFSVIRVLSGRRLLFDYLIPAELFPVALAGGILLLWAALRAHTYQRLVGWSLGTAVLLLAAGQGLAVVTGLASGETEAVGWPWALVVTSLVIYILALLVMAIGGILLLWQQFRTQKELV